MEHDSQEIAARLRQIVGEVEKQGAVSAPRGSDMLSFDDDVLQIQEFIGVGEYSLAYESIVSILEEGLYVISSRAAVALLELGLIFKYKTELPDDKIYDFRNQS